MTQTKEAILPPVFVHAEPGDGVDTISLREAILGLAGVVLPRGPLCSFRHPAIAPLLCIAADMSGCGRNLRIFDSVAAESDARARSQFAGRFTWLSGDDWREAVYAADPPYRAGFFMGGGSVAEAAEKFRAGSPGAPTYFVGSVGGEAERLLGEQELPKHLRQLLKEDLVYDAVFRRLLGA